MIASYFHVSQSLFPSKQIENNKKGKIKLQKIHLAELQYNEFPNVNQIVSKTEKITKSQWMILLSLPPFTFPKTLWQSKVDSEKLWGIEKESNNRYKVVLKTTVRKIKYNLILKSHTKSVLIYQNINHRKTLKMHAVFEICSFWGGKNAKMNASKYNVF